MIQRLPAAQQSFVMDPPPIQQQGYFEATRPRPQPTVPRYYDAPPALIMQQQYIKPPRNTRVGSCDFGSSSPKSPGFHVVKRKSPKRKQATPITVAGTVDFVNFTPNDRKKILTGVAPSGSSKTKARREKEAIEKRRRLSQAAVRAVRAAGGDVESLVKPSLFL